MKLVWSYSKDWKKGSNISIYPHEYIQYLYKRSIKSASDDYHKIIYTDEENVDIFMTVKRLFDLENPKHSPIFTEFRTQAKRKV